MALAGPELGTVDDVALTVAHGARLQRGEIRAGIRFGKSLAPEHITVGNAGKNAFLLVLGTEFDRRRPKHAGAENHRPRRIGQCDLALENVGLFVAPPGAAVFHRP
jgi:hypothetical protein